jgi:hypothetical protein
MPCSSSALTSEASVKRGGGSVKCCCGVDLLEQFHGIALVHGRQHVIAVIGGGVVAPS